MAPLTDDFDVAKLQKSLTQQRRHSLHARSNMAKLSPAEIRSLNHSALTSRVGSQSSSQGTSPSTSLRRLTATPPATPENATAYQVQMSRTMSAKLPTPPHSPHKERRRSSQSCVHPNGYIHTPRPRASLKADFMVTGGVSSRPSSAAPWSHRSLPTYRGPEMTRTGSLTMLQHPDTSIVTNPLSNFSRPRQSAVNSSPDRYYQDFPEMDAYQAENMLNRSESMTDDSTPESRVPSPPRVTDSPVSIEGNPNDTEKFIVLNSETEPEPQQSRPIGIDTPKEIPWGMPDLDNMARNDLGTMETPAPEIKSNVLAEPMDVTPVGDEQPKKEGRRRFSLTSGLFEKKDKEKSTLVKKQRRRTLSFTKSGSTTQGSEEASHLSQDLINTSQETNQRNTNEDFTSHPAIRPLSIVIPTDVKGKGRESHSGPAYGRCACCGKLKRPAAYTAELSPVLENENVRANFSFELDRQSHMSERPTTSNESRSKYTPIIPMDTEDGVVQASIEPYAPKEVRATPTPSDSGSSRKMRRLSEPPKIVRFASLHGRRGSESDGGEEDDRYEEITGRSTPAQDIIAVVRPVIQPEVLGFDGPERVRMPPEVQRIAAAPNPPVVPDTELEPDVDGSVVAPTAKAESRPETPVKAKSRGVRFFYPGKSKPKAAAELDPRNDGSTMDLPSEFPPEAPMTEGPERTTTPLSQQSEATVVVETAGEVKMKKAKGAARFLHSSKPKKTTAKLTPSQPQPCTEQQAAAISSNTNASKFEQYGLPGNSKKPTPPPAVTNGALQPLPQPLLGPHFASDSTLGDFVFTENSNGNDDSAWAAPLLKATIEKGHTSKDTNLFEGMEADKLVEEERLLLRRQQENLVQQVMAV